MKKIIYFFVGCILVGFLMSAIFGSLPVFPFVAKGFLISVSNERYEEAYSMLSKGYQQRMDLPKFKENILKSGLSQYKDAKWIDDVIAPDHKEGYLRGVVTTKSDMTIEIKFSFIQVQGTNWFDKGWRINDIYIPGQAGPRLDESEEIPAR